MAITTAHYTSQIITDLTDRTIYEAWVLEAVYNLTDFPIAVSDNDNWIYPANGGQPTAHHYATAHLVIGDWKPQFLEVGTPLVFVATYKLLDMVVEWVLHQNVSPVPWRFVDKIAALGRQVVFPALIENRTWLRNGLTALYEELAPLRNTVIHSRSFQSNNGTLSVTPDRGKFANQNVTLDASVIRTFAVLMVSLIRFLEGTWIMDSFQEKRLRRALDELQYLHSLATLGQKVPVFQSVRIFVPDEDPIRVNVERARNDLAARYATNDVVIGIRIVAVARDGQTATAYQVGPDQLQNVGTHLDSTRAALAGFSVPLPDDIEPMASAIAMGLVTPTPPAQSGNNP